MKENSKLPETRSKIYEDNPGLGSEQIFKAQIEGFKQQHQQPVEHDKPKVSDIPFHDLFWKFSITRLKLHTIYTGSLKFQSPKKRQLGGIKLLPQVEAEDSKMTKLPGLALNLSYHEKLSKVTEYVANSKIVYYLNFH